MDKRLHRFIGISHLELNCWQLFVHLQRKLHEIELPPFDEALEDNYSRETVGAVILNTASSNPSWDKVSLQDARQGDALLLWLRTYGGERLPTHIGYDCGYRSMMLHTVWKRDSMIETYATGFWSDRIMSRMRYVG